MVTNKSGGTRRGKNGRKTRGEGSAGLVRDNKLVTAAAVGGAVAAGAFLWSRRSQIGEQIGKLSGNSESGSTSEVAAGEGFAAESASAGDGRSQSEIAEEALTLKEIGAAS